MCQAQGLVMDVKVSSGMTCCAPTFLERGVMSENLCMRAPRALLRHQYRPLLYKHGGYFKRTPCRHPRALSPCRKLGGVRLCSCLALATPSILCGEDEWEFLYGSFQSLALHPYCWPPLDRHGGYLKQNAMPMPANSIALLKVGSDVVVLTLP